MSAEVVAAELETGHALDPARPRHRESIVWVVPQVTKGVTAFVYTWVNSQGIAGAALSVFGPNVGEAVFEKVDGIVVAETASFDDYSVGPLRLQLDGDGVASSVSFSGDQVSIALRFSGAHRAYRYSTHPAGCPSFFADDRLEQAGTAEGTLHVDGIAHSFEAPCQRDHSWGERDWDAMHHMKWVNALNDTTAVHAVELLAYGQRYVRGFLYRDGRCVPLRDLSLEYSLDSGLLHRSMSAKWTDEEGRRADVVFDRGGPHFVWDVSPDFTLRDTAVEATIDGVPAVAYVDMSWDPHYMARTADKLDGTLVVSG